MSQPEQNTKLKRLEARRQALLQEMAAVDEKIHEVEEGMVQLDPQIHNISQAKSTRQRRKAA